MRPLVFALVLAAAPAIGADGGARPPDEMRRLEAREIIVRTEDLPGHRVPRMHVLGIVQAPPEKVWAIVTDCNGYAKTMPRTLESRETGRDGDRVRCRAIVDMPFPFGDLVSETEAVHTVVPGVSYRRAWTHLGGDFDANDGSWTLEPHAGGAATLVVYQSLFEPRIAIPGWLQSWAQNVTMPRMIEGLREQLE